ncbi:hypothetical protein [Scytonema millei]|uniref:Uncharacterized protein n=1 Tax=Scytonema millei VB511283 TaxID=1245923 RepID=A0A9X5I345_9CYAN|nr:hypothetical protein [Scytonema millei]NHC34063.1 hypothetical protein [Scytonema millei VB511283]
MNLSVDRRNITNSHHSSKMILACKRNRESGVGSRWGTRRRELRRRSGAEGEKRAGGAEGATQNSKFKIQNSLHPTPHTLSSLLPAPY